MTAISIIAGNLGRMSVNIKKETGELEIWRRIETVWNWLEYLEESKRDGDSCSHFDFIESHYLKQIWKFIEST